MKNTRGLGSGAGHWPSFLSLTLLISLVLNLATLVVPLYDMHLYDRVLQSRNMSTLTMLSLACLTGLLLFAILDLLRSAAFIAIAATVARRLEGRLSVAAVARGLTGQEAAGTEAIRDLNEVRGFLASGLLAVPLDALCTPVFLAVLYLLHPAYFYLALGGAAALLLASLIADRFARPAVQTGAAERAAANAELARLLADRDVTEALGMLPAIARRWASRQTAATAMLRTANGHAHLLAGLARLIRLVLQCGVIMLGAVLILHHETTPGSLMGANLLLNKLLGPFDQLVGSWRQWSAAHAAWTRISAMIHTIPADPRSAPLAAGAGLMLQAVAVNGSGRRLLNDVTLAIPPGQAIAIVGPNGAGKTTLLRLIAGLRLPDAGHVLLDGTAITAADRTRIGYLPQAIGLLSGSVADNIARFCPNPTASAAEAARSAGVHALIGRLPQGYDTPLHAGTAALSGGQRQRIGLARALFGTPALIVLDEPDASLDHDGDMALLEAIAAARAAGSIVVLSTHRPILLAAMDRIVTLADGMIAA